MVIYAVLFVENSIAEMARNTRTPYKYQYYALGRYYYEKYERIYERYSLEEFIHFLPDNIIKEGIDSGIINTVAADSRQYNEDVAKAVVVTFFYYMALLDRVELVDIVEFTDELKPIALHVNNDKSVKQPIFLYIFNASSNHSNSI